MKTPRNSATKARGRPFAPGNPGRPKGTRTRATLASEVLLDGEAETLTRTAIELAKGGDLIALKLCLERIVPPRKGRPVTFDLPIIETAADVLKALAELTGAVSRGELTPEEGAVISTLIEAQRRTIETIDLEARLAAIEEKLSHEHD